MTHTSSKKEELEELLYDVYAHGYAGAQNALDGLSVREALPKLEKIIASRITQALKELKEEVIGEVPSKMNTDNWKYDRRVAELKLWQHQAIDNKIKALEEV